MIPLFTLPEKAPAESVVVQFEFSDELVAIDSAVVSIAVRDGADPAAAAMLVGALQIQGASVLQRVGAGVDQVNYLLRCVATHGEDVRENSAMLPVRAA